MTKTITFPDGADWGAALRGCLLLLTQEENWEQFGILTPQETSDQWLEVFLDFMETSPMLIPPGVIFEFAGETVPDGWLLADGSPVNRITYAALFAVIGTVFGAGDGSTTFNLPNRKGRVGVGKDATQTEFDNLGETGGEKAHLSTIEEMPNHRHLLGNAFSNRDEPINANLPFSSGASMTYSGYTDYMGGGQPHNNLQPYVVLNYIIKT